MCGHADHELHQYFTKSVAPRTSTPVTPDPPGGDGAAPPGHQLADGPRMDTYGHPAQAFTRIAALWSAYLGTTITPHDVGTLMVLLKASRLRTTPGHPDSLDDIEGYVHCLRLLDQG